LALSAGAAPALADNKAGVDAWTRGDYENAVNQWREPALKGDGDAQFNLGQAYKLGRGIKTDLDVALSWYRKAAAQGHLQAADACGHLLHYQQKIPEALPFLQASADRGDPRAQYLLATELFNGVHIRKDWVRAYALMTRASSSGMAPASRSLAQMDQFIPMEQRQAAAVLAGELEQRAVRNRAAQVAGFPSDVPVAVGSTEPATVMPEASKVAATNMVAPVEVPWRIQLGAFANEANAKKLWNTLEGKLSSLSALQPYLKASGAITRLQAGPFASKSAADAMCSKVKASGQACLAVPES
jgi:cell division septation protein DedD